MKPWCHQGRCGVPPRQGQAAVDSFSRYEPVPEVAVHPSLLSSALVYPPSQMVGGHATEARQQSSDRRQSRGERETGPRVLVPGSNYFLNLEKSRMQQQQATAQEQSRRRGFGNSDSEEEMEDSDEESDAGSSDDEGGRRLTRFDVDHDDINPLPPRHEHILRTAWV
jgi:hypothetical protein